MYFYTRNCVSEKTTYTYIKIVFSALFCYLIHKRVLAVFGTDRYHVSG